jgi:dihydrofolate reductase
MRISLIAAHSTNLVIGSSDGTIPWRIRSDFQHFKGQTLGKPVVMGRKTFDSILKSLGKALPNRQNIVLSRQGRPAHIPPEVLWCNSVDECVKELMHAPHVMVAGGGEIYRQFLHCADELILTHVHTHINVPNPVFFPKFKQGDWRVVEELALTPNTHNSATATVRWLKRAQ